MLMLVPMGWVPGFLRLWPLPMPMAGVAGFLGSYARGLVVAYAYGSCLCLWDGFLGSNAYVLCLCLALCIWACQRSLLVSEQGFVTNRSPTSFFGLTSHWASSTAERLLVWVPLLG